MEKLYRFLVNIFKRSKLHSIIKLERCNRISKFFNSELPKIIDRYFDTPETRDSFLKGNIWFCGPNQNRLSVPDLDEYANELCTFLHEYALSFSDRITKKNVYNATCDAKVNAIRLAYLLMKSVSEFVTKCHEFTIHIETVSTLKKS